jgi:dTDP-glucose 4,6-dehydratase
MVQDGWEVIGLDVVAHPDAWRLRGLKIDYRWGSCQDIHSLETSYVVHCASQGDVPLALSAPTYTVSNNVGGTLALLDAARRHDGLERFLLQSSEEVYGYCSRLPIKETEPLNPTNVYGASKAAQELLSMAYHHCYGLPVTVLRSSTIIGHGMRKTQVIPIFLEQALRSGCLTIQGTGAQSRDFNPVENHIDAIMAALAKPRIAGQTLNVGSGEERSILDVAHACIGITDSNSRPTFLPWRPGEEGLRVVLDISKAQSLLGYTPRVSFIEALEEMSAALMQELKRSPIATVVR